MATRKAKERWIVYLWAKDGLLLGGVRETTSSAFSSRVDAAEWLMAMTDKNTDPDIGHKVLGPGIRVQLSPATDRWMMGDRYGTVLSVEKGLTVRVKLDKSGVTRVYRAAYLAESV